MSLSLKYCIHISEVHDLDVSRDSLFSAIDVKWGEFYIHCIKYVRKSKLSLRKSEACSFSNDLYFSGDFIHESSWLCFHFESIHSRFVVKEILCGGSLVRILIMYRLSLFCRCLAVLFLLRIVRLYHWLDKISLRFIDSHSSERKSCRSDSSLECTSRLQV